MTVITVDYAVFMTQYHNITDQQSIGTDGLGPCIGIVAHKKDNTVFCAHLACSIVPSNADNIKLITEKSKTVLTPYLNSKDVSTIFYVSGNPRDKSADAMFQGLQAVYGANTLNTGNGVYWDKKLKTAIATGAQTIVGTTKGPQDDNGPIEVKK
ncbi:hypothetical protein CYY_004494 [Polysphondylium violaceum]|uniref:Uncharacterized protein n=1 Tax=Polysphondylium violaceum TaxID=133409 RepID=A0A8J4PT98_9MYCE|nr:hypothetical protein CYY_004494 [Polysphondylium violaceum]